MKSGYSSDAISLITQIILLVNSMDLDSQPNQESELISLITQTTSLFNSMDLDSLPKPLSELMSFTTHKISRFNYMDLDSLPESLSELLSIISQNFSSTISRHLDKEFRILVNETMTLELELISLIHQVSSVVISMYSKSAKFISLCPQQEDKFRLTGEDPTHFLCQGCNGENHEEYDKAPVVIKHTLHPKHPLQLVLSRHYCRTRECYCCDKDLNKIFYYCSACDLAINLACVEKAPVLSIDHPKCHEHTLALFPIHTSLTCDLCGLADSSCPFYICSPCGFAVHQTCTSLPRIINISGHEHRITFTPSFDQREWSCGVCHKKIDNDYGGYSCTRKDCLFATHVKCATQRDVTEEEEEEENEVVEPFTVVSEGIIHHFSHQHHHLKLDENSGIDYDENKMCQACKIPIYFGNFYSCMECEFILHKVCAEFPRTIHHKFHPHWLNLVVENGGVRTEENKCSVCPWMCTAGLFYKCFKEQCRFKLHVQCATIQEPLVHESHAHPLFLTSNRKEQRTCHVCKESGHCSTNETFNCIQCDFAMCFRCVTLPQKVRYIDDEHELTLSYGEKISTKTHWCEECERKIDQSILYP
ncbi:hypothetical protein AXX17_AT5G43730 [Arabidopsis thaliana]|uniref:DC1 domain-containing protein n=1 Tax=Arabidopsis thaliana TaxID=3702 RepID=A0A178U9E9_ARATH|nr:hypothetical protein AXX17_AT5G43730 [Arabidopsis thaliana]